MASSIVNSLRGWFPFPIVDAPLWNGSTKFALPLYDGFSYAFLSTLRVPGQTGAQLTNGLDFGTGAGPNVYPDSTPILEYKPVVGAGTFYPCGMALDSATKLYWRVKKWNWSSNWSSGAGANTYAGIGQIGTFINNVLYHATFPPQLLINALIPNIDPDTTTVPGNPYVPAIQLFSAANWGVFIQLIQTEGGSDPFTGESLNLNFGNLVNTPAVVQLTLPPICRDPNTNLYYPLMLFGGTPDPAATPSNPVFISSSPWSVIESIDSESSGHATSPSMTFTESSLTFVFTSGMTPLGPTTASEVTTLSPLEYWPYDPDDGLGPYYNTSTGAQIR